jgi:CMP-N,N'-diacetyllegionaminic acid synthase
MSVLALIPARAGSKGIPGKNLREFGGRTLIQRAIMCAVQAGVWPVYVSTDIPQDVWQRDAIEAHHMARPKELAQDDTPMIDVVRHALAAIPGEPEQIIVLLQPTQPFRKPEHVREAIRLLQETGADSVVSVVELPKSHHAWMQLVIYAHGEQLSPYEGMGWQSVPSRRQDARSAYIRDGTVYAFKRATVERYGTIYGQDVRPLIIAPEDTCELDTEDDWREVERRWKDRV